MGVVARRFDVFIVRLDPTEGSEIRKSRPCVVVSPDELNFYIATVIIAPMTTRGQPYPYRVPCRFQRKDGQILLDQLLTVDKSRLIRRLGRITSMTQKEVLAALAEIFAE